MEPDGRAPCIRVELRQSERTRIERGAMASGYRSLTDYARSVMLEHSDRACAAAADREAQG